MRKFPVLVSACVAILFSQTALAITVVSEKHEQQTRQILSGPTAPFADWDDGGRISHDKILSGEHVDKDMLARNGLENPGESFRHGRDSRGDDECRKPGGNDPAAPVPEPSTIVLLVLGLGGLAFAKYRRRTNLTAE
jgi:hypothetical protein